MILLTARNEDEKRFLIYSSIKFFSWMWEYPLALIYGRYLSQINVEKKERDSLHLKQMNVVFPTREEFWY